MEKRYLTVKSLERRLGDFERRYAMDTEDLLAACRAGGSAGIPCFEAFVWAATYRQLCRLRLRQVRLDDAILQAIASTDPELAERIRRVNASLVD